MADEYQERYERHRRRKAAMIAGTAQGIAPEGTWAGRTFEAVVAARRSVRVFSRVPLPRAEVEAVMEAARLAPQSCNRQAMTLHIVPGWKLANLLAGGARWACHAPAVALVFADLSAYKSPDERSFMPWLDAGVILATVVYAAASRGVGSCIVNPRVEPGNELAFRALFNPGGLLFCGAVALGYPGMIPDMPEKKPLAALAAFDRDVADGS